MFRNKVLVSLMAFGFAAALPTAVYATELVTNGGFESNGGNGQLGYNTSATGWNISGGYTFLFNPQTGTTSGTSADNSGANGQYGSLWLWGPGNGSANGLTTSPTGGAFIAQDSDFQQAPIWQTINNLTIGQSYAVNFDWAAAQQEFFNGPTADQWVVSLGEQSQATATYNLPSHAFSGWMHQAFDFTATDTSETLSFFAQGSPQGPPPFALLDGVSMQAVPEAGSGAAMLLGVVGFGMFARRRARSAK